MTLEGVKFVFLEKISTCQLWYLIFFNDFDDNYNRSPHLTKKVNFQIISSLNLNKISLISCLLTFLDDRKMGLINKTTKSNTDKSGTKVRKVSK